MLLSLACASRTQRARPNASRTVTRSYTDLELADPLVLFPQELGVDPPELPQFALQRRGVTRPSLGGGFGCRNDLVKVGLGDGGLFGVLLRLLHLHFQIKVVRRPESRPHRRARPPRGPRFCAVRGLGQAPCGRTGGARRHAEALGLMP